MIHKKILGIFKALPLESLDLTFISKIANMEQKFIKPVLKTLKSQGHIRGIRKFKLSGKHLKIFKEGNPMLK